MMLHHEILGQLKQYAEGRSSAESVESWILSQYQSILNSGERDAINLANEINALFVELGEQVIAQEECDRSLATILERERSTISLRLGDFPIVTEAQQTVRKSLVLAPRVTTVHRDLQVPSAA